MRFTVSGADADAAWHYGRIVGGVDLNNNVNGGPGRLWGPNNTVYGAASAIQIPTGYGADLVFDGRGAAECVEITGGSLTIAVFHDSGPRAHQDVIRMTRRKNRNMMSRRTVPTRS